MVAKVSAAGARRVKTLLNAIADLQEGDLLAVLKLNAFTPLREFGPNDTFKLGEDGKIVYTPGWPPAPPSLKHGVQTGEALARIFEGHLTSILGFGEAELRTCGKPRWKNHLGARRFV